MPSLQSRLERSTLVAAMRLPPRLVRALAGRRIVLDGQTLAPDVQLMLRLQKVSGTPGAETVPVEQGREILRRTTYAASGAPPIGSVSPVTAAGLPARLYVPAGPGGRGGRASDRLETPLLVFFHGGGFFCGDLETHDGACRVLAESAGVRVLSVDYRQGPEDPFPAAHDDAIAAYRWACEHLAELGATAIGVGGDSAGGNLSANVAIEAARAGLPCAVQVLIYPTATATHDTASAALFGEGFYLTNQFMDLAHLRYVHTAAPGDPRIELMTADLPDGLAPALVFTAGFDPLRDEGEAYAARLTAAGVPTTLRRFPDLIHGFLNVADSAPAARAANAEIAAATAAAFATPG